MNEIEVRNLILNWYEGTNEHVEVEQLELMLSDDVKMSYPNTSEIIVGKEAFRKWYSDVLQKYFDETYIVEFWDIRIDENIATVVVKVRWETRLWVKGARRSDYNAYLSQQRFVIKRDESTGILRIHEKHAETFENIPAIHGPSLLKSGYYKVETAIEIIKNNKLTSLKEWLQSGGNPNQYAEDGWTPLLLACVRGRSAMVSLLINNEFGREANPNINFLKSGALPIHFLGHAGDVGTAEVLLTKFPEQLNKVWNLNGHTLLLQAVFYNHTELVEFALRQGADAYITTARGLNCWELAKQFDNLNLMALIEKYGVNNNSKREKYYDYYLNKIAAFIPEKERAYQEKTDHLINLISDGFSKVSKGIEGKDKVLTQIEQCVISEDLQINRLGGKLQQPALIVAVTGNNGQQANLIVAQFRYKLVEMLLKYKANPFVQEKHPMGVNAIIRAAVFNHIDILKLISKNISSLELSESLNERPAVNGLTALHDTVLRAGTVSAEGVQGYLEQIKWCVHNGASYNIEDFSGRTQLDIAESIKDKDRKHKILSALIAN